MARCWMKAAAVSAVSSIVAYRTVLRPWHERWGATDDEVNGPLPGDELIAEPAGQTTRAITIDAPPEAVWPWVVQIGADRGGFYSYDWLENLCGLGIHSADRAVPAWRTRAVGDLVYGDASGSGGWYVMDVRPNEALVLKMAYVKEGRPAQRDDPGQFEFLWTFALKDGGDGTTRLLVRERVAFGSKAMERVMGPVGAVSFVMTRKMLQGIKERAEAVVTSPTPAHRIVTVG